MYSLTGTLLSVLLFTDRMGEIEEDADRQAAKNKTDHPMQVAENDNLDKATLGAGCFWCVEAVFQELEGVKKVISGYSGGHVENPTYEQVCGKKTGHAEVIQIEYDPTIISYPEILEVFWKTHDPTTPDRQGNDVGPQYRSVIFFHDEQQKSIAEKSRAEAQAYFSAPIVTEIAPFRNFYVAENYHQDFYRLNGNYPYCRFVIDPKMAKFRKEFSSKLKEVTN